MLLVQLQLQPQIKHTDVRVGGGAAESPHQMSDKCGGAAACTHMHAIYLIKVESCQMWACWGFLTAGSVDDIAQLSVFPLAEVVLFHASGGFGCLHLRTPVMRST